jgi:hypothetical protein
MTHFSPAYWPILWAWCNRCIRRLCDEVNWHAFFQLSFRIGSSKCFFTNILENSVRENVCNNWKKTAKSHVLFRLFRIWKSKPTVLENLSVSSVAFGKSTPRNPHKIFDGIKINNYRPTLAFKMARVTPRTELTNFVVLITQRSCWLVLKDWGLNFF